jgi:membrane-associated protease RseP (regulator of RpoE activity)
MLGEKWSNEIMVLSPAAIAAETTEEARWWRDKGQKNVLHMLREVKLRFNVDDNRVFVTGMSDGGSGSFCLASRRPDSFAGFFPLVGHPLIAAMDGTRMFWENMRGSRIYAVSGGKDPLYPASQVARSIKEANENGATIEQKIYENAGHDLSYAPKEIPVILEDKVAKWTRELAIKDIDWSTDSAGMGRRAWLAISELAKLGDKNARDFAATPRTGQARVMLGITIDQEADPADPVIVASVAPDSVAEKIGIKVGDKITKLDDTKTANLNELREALSQKNQGDDVRVTVERDGKSVELKGKFPAPKASKDDAVLARVQASHKPLKAQDEKGSVQGTLFEIRLTNASKLTLYLTAEQVKLGKAVVTINGGEPIVLDKLAESAEVVLAEFERHADRKSPYVAKIEIDVAKHLGIKVKPVPGESDDDDGEGF